jgi:MoaA/NifB/PqqE/SkfB family radical SAM enzyme
MQKLKKLIKNIPFLRNAVKRIYDELNERNQAAGIGKFLSGHLPFSNSVPEKLSIGHEPTIRCNLRCKMCYQGETRNLRLSELSEQEVFSIMQKLETKARRVKLVGGEPLIRGDIFRMIEFWDKRGMEMSLQSNCTLIDENNIQTLKKYRRLTNILTSLDGPPEVHDRVRGVPGSFDRLKKAISLVRENMPWVNFTLFATLLPFDNLSELRALVDTTKSLGLGTINILFEQVYSPVEIEAAHHVIQNRLGWDKNSYRFNTQTREKILPEDLDIRSFRNKLDDVRKYGLKTGCFVNFSPPNYYHNLEKYAGTRAGRAFCTKLMSPELRIDQKGNVLWCDIIDKSFGNLLEMDPDEIWLSEEYQKFRQYLFSGSLPICRRCCKAVYIK